jgi:hypothetical protein
MNQGHHEEESEHEADMEMIPATFLPPLPSLAAAMADPRTTPTMTTTDRAQPRPEPQQVSLDYSLLLALAIIAIYIYCCIFHF